MANNTQRRTRLDLQPPTMQPLCVFLIDTDNSASRLTPTESSPGARRSAIDITMYRFILTTQKGVHCYYYPIFTDRDTKTQIKYLSWDHTDGT